MNFSSHTINDWLAGRPWKRIWRSAPALLGFSTLLITTLLISATRGQKQTLQFRYEQIAKTALATGNFEVARVVCLRGLDFATDSQARLKWLFYLSGAMQGLGHHTEASALMAVAAPSDHPGCPEAQVAVAAALLNSTNLTPIKLRLAQHQLQNALLADPQSVETRELLGRFYINTHDWAQAKKYLMEVYPHKNEVAMLLAIVEKGMGHEDKADSWLDAAIDAYQMKLQNVSPQDSQSDRLNLVRIFLMKNDFSAAAKTLKAGLSIRDMPAYRSALGQTYERWIMQFTTNDPDDVSGQLKLISEGLEYVPDDIKLRLQLVAATHVAGETGQAARVLLEHFLSQASGDSAAWWHFCMWTDSRVHDELQEGRRQLQKAFELAPQIPAIRNDMALELSAGNQIEANRGLKIAQDLVKQFPENPEFRDTRGRIFSRLGDNTAAIADLEFAASKLTNSADTRMALANVYAITGKKQLAEHERHLAGDSSKAE